MTEQDSPSLPPTELFPFSAEEPRGTGKRDGEANPRLPADSAARSTDSQVMPSRYTGLPSCVS